MRLSLTMPSGTIEFDLQKKETTIGRADTCDWSIPSDRLSRVHCVLHHFKDPEKGERFSIVDPGSKNGVMVDGNRIEPNTMVPVGKTSLILLANEYILTIGAKKKVEMIDSGEKVVAPVKLKRMDPREMREPKSKWKGVVKSLVKKLAYLTLLLLGAIGGAIYFLMYK